MQIVTRSDLIRLLRAMADPGWLGGMTDRMMIAKTAADVIETYGESVDRTQTSIQELHAKVDELAVRLSVK